MEATRVKAVTAAVRTEAAGGIPAQQVGVLERLDPQGAPLPVVFDSPHSGRQYPPDFGYGLRYHDLRAAEDMYVDELFSAAPRHGATLLRALFPRSYIDVNRRITDIDESLLNEPWPQPVYPSGKTRDGRGLVRKWAKHGPIYARKLSVAEVRGRIENYYQPYHDALSGLIAERHRQFGAVWHINCHSWMPPEAGRDGKPLRHVDFFIGDREGTSSGPEFTRLTAAYLRSLGYRVLVNRLFKGKEVVRRSGKPKAEQHSVQVEINRTLYMDPFSYEKTRGFAVLQQDLGGLMQAVCDHARAKLASQTAEPLLAQSLKTALRRMTPQPDTAR